MTGLHTNHHQIPTWLDDPQSPVEALDMTEQNYEEQAAEAAAAAATQGTPQATATHASQPSNRNEELEDNFHIDLD